MQERERERVLMTFLSVSIEKKKKLRKSLAIAASLTISLGLSLISPLMDDTYSHALIPSSEFKTRYKKIYYKNGGKKAADIRSSMI